MPVYRAIFELEVEADVNYTVPRERDIPYPNDRTAIGAFEEKHGDSLISIEDLEENRMVYERPSDTIAGPGVPLNEMSRDQLDEIARSLDIDPEPLNTKADVIVAIDLVQKSD